MTTQGIPSIVNVVARYLPAPSAQDIFGESLFVYSNAGVPTDVGGTALPRARRYSSLSAMTSDYATTHAAYLAATAFFSADPFPRNGLWVGWWDTTNDANVGAAVAAIEAVKPDYYFVVPNNEAAFTDAILQAFAMAVNGSENDHYIIRAHDDADIRDTTAAADTTTLWASWSDYDRAAMIWTADLSEYKDMALMGLMAGIDWEGTNTVIDPAYKTLTGTTVDTFTDTQIDNLTDKRVNYYSRTVGRSLFRYGWSLESGIWMDGRVWLDWFVFAVQRAVFDVLTNAPVRVPGNALGVSAIQNAVEEVCRIGIGNGGIGRGQLNAQTTGEVRQVTGNNGFSGFLNEGYLVHVGSIADLTAAQLGRREAPPINIWLRFIGAIHTADISIVFQG